MNDAFRQKASCVCVNNDMLKALGINLIALLISLVCFEFTVRWDDREMALALYGAYGAMKPYNFVYGNTLYGIFLIFFMKTFPQIPWYTVFFVLFIFVSFCTITYIFLKKDSGYISKLCIGSFLFVGCILFYKNLDFTMIAGLLLTAGLIYLLYMIQTDGKFYRYIWGICLVFIALLLRQAMLNLILVIFVTSFIVVLFMNEERNRKVKKIIIFVGLCLLFEAANYSLNMYQKSVNAKEDLTYYQEINSKRALIFDYNGFPDYDLYEKEYQELGISRADYTMWAQYHLFSDMEATNDMNLFEKIYQIAPVLKKNIPLAQQLTSAVHKLNDYIFHTYMIYLLIFGGVLLVLLKKESIWIVCLEVFFCLFAYFYMSYLGRVMRYVNEPIIFASSILLLYYCDKQHIGEKERKHITTFCFFCLLIFLAINHEKLATSSFLDFDYIQHFVLSDKERREETYKRMKLISDDKKHLYFYDPHDREIGATECFSAFQRPPYGFGDNMYYPGDIITIYQQLILEKYGIKNGNPFRAMTDNEDIFWCSSQEHSQVLPAVRDYIRQRYCPDAEYQLVKNIEDVFIYRFHSGKFQFAWEESDIIMDGDITSDIKVTPDDENDCLISGYAFVEGEDSFTQNIYISVTDNITNEETFFYTLQEENEQLHNKDKYSGRYSKFSAQITLPNIINNVSIAVYIDTGNGVYKINCNI